MRQYYLAALLVILFAFHLSSHALPCPFDAGKTCTLYHDILNDRAADGLAYFAPTNYDHRISGEINIFDAALVQPYTDVFNKPGQIKLTANLNGNLWKSGEIMTRKDLNLYPYNSPIKSHAFTTKEVSHGYIEERIKLPKCDISDDGLCQAHSNPDAYNRGMWPSIWLLPTFDTNWPQNGEIDIFEAYKTGLGFNDTTTTLHFNGNSPSCGNGDCKFIGLHLPDAIINGPFYNDFHTYGFEWQPDPKSANGGVIMTGYFDNAKLWGPLATDTLPADGAAAFRRGFNDANGGFYLITALAMGGPYAGPVNNHLRSASMYIQSIRVYSVNGSSPPHQCLPPTNITASYTSDKKQITLHWSQPINSDPISSYQISDWLNRPLWSGTPTTYTDKTLPGTNGKFTYFLYSRCASGLSSGVQEDVIIK